jgi:hypothetical protein
VRCKPHAPHTPCNIVRTILGEERNPRAQYTAARRVPRAPLSTAAVWDSARKRTHMGRYKNMRALLVPCWYRDCINGMSHLPGMCPSLPLSAPPA